MQSVGRKLRDARESQGRTLEQVNSSTRISVKILEAIEADEVRGITSAFLYRSFVRQFAEDLSLDYAELHSLVHAVTERMPAPLVPGQSHSFAPHVAALDVGRKRNFRWMQSFSMFAAAVVACSGIYAFWQNSKLNLPGVLHRMSASRRIVHSWSKPAATKNEAPERLGRQGVRAAVATPQLEPDKSPATGETNRPAGGFTLELSATEPAWLSIIADGKISFKGILEKAETKILEGHRTARIRTGNAGGVEVVFNGKSLGALGSRGQVRTVLFTKSDYEVLDTRVRNSLLKINPTAELAVLRPPLDLLFANF